MSLARYTTKVTSLEQLPAGSLSNSQRSDYAHASYFVELPGNVPLTSVFAPIFWAHHAKMLKKYDLIRLRCEEAGYDFQVSVEEVRIGGLRVLPWPRQPKADGDIASVAASSIEAKQYGDDLTPRIEYRKATKWRVIGHDNNEHSAGYENKRAAAVAMIRYMVDLGFTPEKVNAHMHKLGIGALMDDEAA